MAAPKQISPLLDGYRMGEAISSHNGVICYPAMQDHSDDKYIVKTIAVPASNVQLAALLLSGAYSSRQEALAYYLERAKEILQEARTINELSHLDGFLPYLGAQIAEKDDGTGYQVYLLNVYRQSLAQIFSEQAMTHKAIFDLAMDLCSALSSCRNAGYLYIDLKPENIFFTQDRGYRISDLGFLPLASLKYASLPEKYHSVYTAPEIQDAVSELNTTLDVYALGLILYQAYNGGILPSTDLPLEAPMYADYEMAEIILTACHSDPSRRWQTPEELGQALVQYMQRNSVEDISIIPAPVTTPELDVGEEFLPEEETNMEEWEDIPELAFLQSLSAEETSHSIENIPDLADTAIGEDISQMLAQADELIAHPLPDPVVAPAPIEVPMPEPIVIEPDPVVEAPAITEAIREEMQQPVESEPEAPLAVQPEEAEPIQDKPVEATSEEIPVSETQEEAVPKRKFSTRWILPVILAILVVTLAYAGFYYYQNFYLQTIDSMTITGTVDSITVQLETEADETLLRVICSDTYGNTVTSTVTGGTAIFCNLTPGTRYTIRVLMDGTHKLTGQITDSFTTETQTLVENLSAVIGPEDGSVVISFQVSGQECDEWCLSYEAPGIAAQTVTFVGHSVTIRDLSIGSDYTFTLSANDEANVMGQTQVTFQAKVITRALNPTITACGGGKLTIEWDCPDVIVEYWTVRCYDGSGYDQTITTDAFSVTFNGLSHETPCTVEITAAGMQQGVSVSVGANPLNITGFTQTVADGQLVISWEYTGTAPDGAWRIAWSRDDGQTQMLESTDAQVAIEYIPGSQYTFSLLPEEDSVIFGHSCSFTAPEAEDYSGHGITKSNLQFMMCATPVAPNWGWADIPEDSYKTNFSVGESAGFVIWCDVATEAAEENLEVYIIVRDAEGNLLDISNVSLFWNTLWNQGFTTLTLPVMPETVGEYHVSIYWDGMLAGSQDFIIE